MSRNRCQPNGYLLRCRLSGSSERANKEKPPCSQVDLTWSSTSKPLGPSGGRRTSTVNGLISMHTTVHRQPVQPTPPDGTSRCDRDVLSMLPSRSKRSNAARRLPSPSEPDGPSSPRFPRGRLFQGRRDSVTGVVFAHGFDLAGLIPGGDGDGEIAGISPYLLIESGCHRSMFPCRLRWSDLSVGRFAMPCSSLRFGVSCWRESDGVSFLGRRSAWSLARRAL